MSWWYRKFHVTDEPHGILGLQLFGHPWFDASTSFGVAHDILEHFPDDSGRMEDEYMALGAIVFVRGYEEWNANQRFGVLDPAEVLSDEPCNQVDYHGIHSVLEAPYRTPNRTDEDFESFLTRFIRQARHDMMDRYGSLPVWLRHGEQVGYLKDWMRIGYQRAQRRYRSHSMSHMVQVFQCVAEQAEEIMKHVNENDRVIIRVEPARIKCEWRYIPDPYVQLDDNYWR